MIEHSLRSNLLNGKGGIHHIMQGALAGFELGTLGKTNYQAPVLSTLISIPSQLFALYFDTSSSFMTSTKTIPYPS